MKSPVRQEVANQEQRQSQVHKGDWVLVRLIEDLVVKAYKDWTDVPRAKRKRWALTLVYGWLATIVLTLALVWGMRWLDASGYLAMEEAWLQWTADHSILPFSKALWLGTPGNIVFIVTAVVLSIGISIRKGRALRAVAILACYVLVSVAIGTGWLIWARSRPDLVADGIASPGLSSFPSGHVAQSIAVYGLLTYFWIERARRWGERLFAGLCFTVLMVVMAYSRLVLGAHWPTDLLGSFVIGTVWLFVVLYALRNAEEPAEQPQTRATLPIGTRDARTDYCREGGVREHDAT